MLRVPVPGLRFCISDCETEALEGDAPGSIFSPPLRVAVRVFG